MATTKYYTLYATALGDTQPGQTVDFTTGKGYYIVGTPTPTTQANDGDPAWMDAGGNPAAPLAPATAPAYPTQSPDTGTDGSGPAPTPSAPAAAAPPPIDWEAALGEYGFTDDMLAQLNQIWATNYQDPSLALTLAKAYVQTTPWYATTYPGIQAGINAGLFNDESGYMAYTNQINQLYQQYYGRVATPAETSQYITSGMAASQVANEFQAQAILGNISDPLKALFTPDELQAYANEQAGIDSQLGQKITAEANLSTQIAPLYQNFYGRAPTRDELDQLTANGTDASTVAQQFATTDNINAMDPAIKDLFTPAEIQEIALEAAGGTTQDGKALTDQANLATQLNSIYHQYTGAGVSRDEVTAAYQAGTSATTVAQQFAGKAFTDANGPDIQQTSGAFGDTGALTPDQLTALGQEQAGLDTPLGQAVTTAYQKAQQRLAGVFKGTLAHPALSALTSQAQKTPDVGA